MRTYTQEITKTKTVRHFIFAVNDSKLRALERIGTQYGIPAGNITPSEVATKLREFSGLDEAIVWFAEN